jgi:predicted GH43/DUF377 family glycosyl hydrolase
VTSSGRSYTADQDGNLTVPSVDAIDLASGALAAAIEQLHSVVHATGGAALDIVRVQGTEILDCLIRTARISRPLRSRGDAASFIETTLKEAGRSYLHGVRMLAREQTTDPAWLRVPNDAPTTPPAMGVIPRVCVFIAATDGVEDPVDGTGPDMSQFGVSVESGADLESVALDRKVTPEARDTARRNLWRHLKTLDELAPSFRARRIEFAAPDGYRAMNPSVCRCGDRVLLVVRCVNYQLAETGLRNRLPAGESSIKTRNFLIRVDPYSFAETVLGEIRAPAGFPPPLCEEVQGFEDARLFSWRGELWTISSVREQNYDGFSEMWLARLDDRLEMCDARAIRLPGERRNEKNWMPLVDGDELRLIYSCDPTRIVDPDGRAMHESTPEIAADNFRGGSQAIPFEAGWLAIIHSTTPGQHASWPVYRHRLAWFDSDFRLRKISPAFSFPFSSASEFLRGYQYAMGLCWHPDNRRLIISYALADREAWLATVAADDIRALLLGRPGGAR